MSELSYPEAGAILGTIGIIAGAAVKIFYKPETTLKHEVDTLRNDFTYMKASFEEHKTHLIKIQNKINDDRERDIDNRDKAFEKIDTKIERLHDLILKLVSKEK